MSWSDMKRLKASEALELVPFDVTSDGQRLFTVCNEEDVIVVKDLHIRVRNALRAQEKKARAGMPREIKIVVPNQES